ncbi:hypothetical protein P5V15_014035 [Pogonomyrmex californicus]
MSLYHFKYIDKRQIVANVANNVGKHTIKAMTLLARMASSDFTTESFTTSTLSHNTATRENLVENNSCKVYQALLETNMATKVGLIALDCLDLFYIHFKV